MDKERYTLAIDGARKAKEARNRFKDQLAQARNGGVRSKTSLTSTNRTYGSGTPHKFAGPFHHRAPRAQDPQRTRAQAGESPTAGHTFSRGMP